MGLSLLMSLLGCTSACDGTYVIFYKMTENSVDPDDNDIGVEDRAMVTIYHTSEGTMVMGGVGALLAGTREGKEFTLTYEAGSNDAPAQDDCDTDLSKATQTYKGTFTGDGGFEGKLTSEQQILRKACGGDDIDELYTMVWQMDGIRVDVDSNRHIGDDANWGYFPSASVY
jgi:hypothetical protein